MFYDDNAIVFDDPDRSIGKERFLIIGCTKTDKVCIVSHCYRDKGDIIRIISARKATKSEKKVYQSWLERGLL